MSAESVQEVRLVHSDHGGSINKCMRALDCAIVRFLSKPILVRNFSPSKFKQSHLSSTIFSFVVNGHGGLSQQEGKRKDFFFHQALVQSLFPN